MNDITQKADKILIRYRARDIRKSDIEFIRTTIQEHFKLSRSKISRILCEKWNWKQPDGKLKESPCRHLLLQLEARGYIELPIARCTNNFLQSGGLSQQEELDLLQSQPEPIVQGDLQTATVQLIEKKERKQWRWYVNQYHYLGHQPIIADVPSRFYKRPMNASSCVILP